MLETANVCARTATILRKYKVPENCKHLTTLFKLATPTLN